MASNKNTKSCGAFRFQNNGEIGFCETAKGHPLRMNNQLSFAPGQEEVYLVEQPAPEKG